MSEITLAAFRYSRRRVEKRDGIFYVQCLGCNKMKPKSNFSPHPCSKIGVVSQCKKCKNKKLMQRIKDRRARLAV